MASNIILLDPHPRPLDLIMSPKDKQRLESLGKVIWHEGSPASDEHIESYLPDTIALIGQTALSKERLDRAPNLKVVFNVESNFLPNVDYAEIQRRNIYMLSTGPIFAQPVAEMALGMALSLASRIHEADAAIRQRHESLYGEKNNYDSFLLNGKTLGLLGCGTLGKALLPLLQPFSRDIIVHDPWLHDSTLREMQVEPVGLQELFSRSKVVFILAATTSENQGLIGKAQFSAMQKGAMVVLASRAGVVHFDDLLDAAQSGHIRVAIDVFPQEPIPADHRARRTPNTLLSAHRAGNIPEVWHGMGERLVDDLELILKGLAPQRCQRANFETVNKLRSMPVS
jgi:phosphoglycerate dehydrogenase-like enzyme